MRALDELLTSWRANPDAAATIAACSYLGSSQREDLIREVAASAETWHTEDAAVILAVGRMYLDAGMLPEAQTSLVSAGKLGGRDPKPFRYLGEVLLRRGDAVRAEKVFARCMQLGMDDGDTRLWHDRAVVYSALQKRVGVSAVAEEVARAMPQQTSLPAAHLPASANPFVDEITRPRSAAAASMPFSEGSAATLRKGSADVLSLSDSDLLSTPSARLSDAFGSGDPLRVSDSDLIEESGPDVAVPPFVLPPPAPLPRRRAPSGMPAPNHIGATGAARARSNPPPSAAAALFSEDHVSDFDDVTFIKTSEIEPITDIAEALHPEAESLHTPVAISRSKRTNPGLAPPPPTSSPDGMPYALRPIDDAAPFSGTQPSQEAPRDSTNPPPRIVLHHLARVGVFEPGKTGHASWETPPRQKSRGAWALALITALLCGAGIAGFKYSKRLQAEKSAHAKELSADVDRLLHSARLKDLQASDAKLSQIFELDSRSPRAARLWLENRVLNLLLVSNEPTGIDSAVHRGQGVGLSEKELAFGRIAAYLAEGDLAGAAALLPRWDQAAARDAHYQLVAGAVLERAGDVRAIERYQKAVELDPKLVSAQILLARALLLETDGQAASSIIEQLRSRHGENSATRALSALSWVTSSERSPEPPSEAQLSATDIESLPAPLKAVPEMVNAALAISKGEQAHAARAIESALSLATGPSVAVSLGFLAIETDNEPLARKAALRALSFAAVYPRARMLAARVAVLGGHIDEAQKAIEGLDPRVPEVAVVRAIVAYESLSAPDLKTALAALEGSLGARPYAALKAAPEIIAGTRYPALAELESMAAPTVPWGDLIAIDAAIATGNLTLAERLLAKHGEALRPVHLLRKARVRRYQGKFAEAAEASASALSAGAITVPLLIEHVYDLVSKDDVQGARDVISKYPALLGPMSAWLSAIVDAAAKQKAQALLRLSTVELPVPEAPLELRLLAARALAASGEKRSRAYVTAVSRSAPKHPEIFVIADLL